MYYKYREGIPPPRTQIHTYTERYTTAQGTHFLVRVRYTKSMKHLLRPPEGVWSQLLLLYKSSRLFSKSTGHPRRRGVMWCVHLTASGLVGKSLRWISHVKPPFSVQQLFYSSIQQEPASATEKAEHRRTEEGGGRDVDLVVAALNG